MEFEECFTIEPDSETHRTCSICGRRKPFSEFYKDGTDKDGNPRHRRDCKVCYKNTRISEQEAKVPKVVVQPRTKKKGGRKK